MWLFLRRLKQEGKEGVEFGQYLYELYNHDVEMRVSKAGVSDLRPYAEFKIFYFVLQTWNELLVAAVDEI